MPNFEVINMPLYFNFNKTSIGVFKSLLLTLNNISKAIAAVIL
jgi:hypothetical protein